MKTSKRSLITAIAILCVCALSLSAASYAWFSASKTAAIENLTLEVKAQSDIKIAANSAAVTEGATSDWWVTTLYQTDFTEANGNELEPQVNDLTPATSGTCDGNFQEPANREDVDTESGAYSGALTSATGGWADFTVYVRTTKNDKDVVMNFSDFALNADSPQGANNVSEALRLGVKDGAILADAKNGEVVIPAAELQELGEGYYYAQVVFYVWVEGTDAACKNANATSLKAYDFNMSFEYAA